MAEARDANQGFALRSSISTCINVGRYSLLIRVSRAAKDCLA